MYEDGSYSQAKEAYQSALLVIPDDSYALGMIDRITEIVNSPDYKKIQNDIAKAKLEKQRQEEERLAAAEAEKQRKAQVQNLINAGNQQLTDKKYAEAENSFNQVLALDPNNAVAIAKLEIIAGFYEEIQRQKMANYNNAMFAGDLAMDKNNFAEAVKQYNIALTYKTGDAEATQKLALARQNEETRVKALEDEYNNYITQADAQYTSKNYDKAIEFYTKAVNVNTGNPYPANKIKQITEMLEANKLVDLVSSAITINANESKRIDFQPIDITVRRSNYIAIKAKSLSEKPVVMYITYGNNTRENGSFTVRVPVKSENDIIVRIGSQYKWFSEDNNWIEIYPENGNIEITSMEITKDN